MKRMKGFLPFAIVGLMLSLGACGANDGGSQSASVTSIPKVTVKTTDDKSSLTLIVGETGQLKASQKVLLGEQKTTKSLQSIKQVKLPLLPLVQPKSLLKRKVLKLVN